MIFENSIGGICRESKNRKFKSNMMRFNEDLMKMCAFIGVEWWLEKSTRVFYVWREKVTFL